MRLPLLNLIQVVIHMSYFRFALLIFVLAVSANAASAAEPPNHPVFRIETGMHTATITRVATDVLGRSAATVSIDKTLRIWELPSGSLLRTIRPPIGEGSEGELLAVALSPDGRTVACSGATWFNNGLPGIPAEGASIYLFDTASGVMTSRIPGLPDTIRRLTFSPDGKMLAASMGRSTGIRLYSVANQNLLGEDSAFEDRSNSVAFSSTGDRLVASSLDGFIRLYRVTEKGLKLLAKERASGGRQPHTARFSPDGREIAVGFLDSNNVDIVSGQNLALLYSPDTSGVLNPLPCVEWSSDSQTLYAGGQFRKGEHWIIRRWKTGGRSAPEDIPVAGNTIMDIAPLPGDGLLFGSSDPAFGVLSNNGSRTLYVSSTIADYRDMWENFRTTQDGRTVGFGFTQWGKSPSAFSLVDRKLIPGSFNSNLLPPKNMDTALVITGCNNTQTPKLNNKPLKLDAYEVAQSFAIAPDSSSFILGTHMYLRRFDRTGKELWKKSTPGATWALNISGNGAFALAAFGDGTIRWYRYSDGREIVSLFPYPDKKRWIMWTPEGYFDASPGGSDFIGYHLNQGKNREARFITLSYLYDVFYRPDIVQAAIRGDDLSGLTTLSAAEALKAPPPDVMITSLATESKNAREKACYKIVATGGGIGEVRLFQNGKLIRSDGMYRESSSRKADEQIRLTNMNSAAIYNEMRGLKVVMKPDSGIEIKSIKPDPFEECVEFDTIPGENEISIAAFNAQNTVQSFMASQSLKVNRPSEQAHLYILAVGIDKYKAQDSAANLKFAAKDARDFLEKMTNKAATVYPPQFIHVSSLRDAEATKEGILEAVRKLAVRVKPWDSFILFVASHGILENNQYHIITSSFDGTFSKTHMISSNEIIDISKQIKAFSQLFIFDTCHAGGVDSIVSGLYDARMTVLAKKMGLHIYASAGSLQEAIDGYQGNGLYTHTLLKGLENSGDVDKEREGKVTAKKLGVYSKEKTIEISTKLGHPQTPYIINFGRDTELIRTSR